jgi:hypothetical protein
MEAAAGNVSIGHFGHTIAHAPLVATAERLLPFQAAFFVNLDDQHMGKLKAMPNCYVAAIARLTAFVDMLFVICAVSSEPFDSRSLCMKNG